MGIKLFFLTLVLLAMSACQLEGTEDTKIKTIPRFETVDGGDNFLVKVPSAFDSTVGWLVVPEDRANNQSTEIRLPVAIIHTRAESPKSPVVYLSGGPGTSAMRTAAFPGAYPWLKERDFIVIGQRGTHYAQPALMCPEYREAVTNGTDRIESVTVCKARLEKANIGLEHYNSVASATDIEALRIVLGIENWNLYGGSYGTRLALTYAKSFAGSLDAMVLDSPLPPNAIYDDQSAENRERSLRAVAQDCALLTACNQAFPNLEERFFQTIESISKSPLEITGLDNPINATDLVSLVPLTSGNDVRRAPLFMDYVARLDPTIKEYLASPLQVNDFAWGMRFSVWCSEALPFSERSHMTAPGSTLGGYESAAIDPALCKAWAVTALEPSFVEAVSSNVPTLIIAGEFDPLTPPAWGKLASETLSKSLVVTVRGDSHGPTQQWNGDGCAMAIANAFMRSPETVLTSPRTDYCVFARPAPDYVLELE